MNTDEIPYAFIIAVLIAALAILNNIRLWYKYKLEPDQNMRTNELMDAWRDKLRRDLEEKKMAEQLDKQKT